MSFSSLEPQGPHKVKLTYFTPDTGAYATEGRYESKQDFVFEIVREVREMLAEGRLPGLRRGFTNVVALISADNAASLRMHRRLGFEEAGMLRRVGHKHGGWVDVAYLQLILETDP